MREIKFRAWDENNEVMEYGVSVDNGRPVKEGYQLYHTGNTVYHSQPMQYTGLTDVNGVEIYEGDILKCFNGSQDKVGTVVHVCYDDTYTGYYPFNRDEVGFNTNSNSIEVIGNIYQHKYLLKENHNE